MIGPLPNFGVQPSHETLLTFLADGDGHGHGLFSPGPGVVMTLTNALRYGVRGMVQTRLAYLQNQVALYKTLGGGATGAVVQP